MQLFEVHRMVTFPDTTGVREKPSPKKETHFHNYV